LRELDNLVKALVDRIDLSFLEADSVFSELLHVLNALSKPVSSGTVVLDAECISLFGNVAKDFVTSGDSQITSASCRLAMLSILYCVICVPPPEDPCLLIQVMQKILRHWTKAPPTKADWILQE